MIQETHILKARLKCGYTQDYVAFKIGRSQPTIQRYESGATPVPRDLAPKLANLLKIPLMDVLYPTRTVP